MTRFFLRLLGIKDFEPCQSCENLKEQLRYERDENQRLVSTLITIVSPKVIEQPPQEINPLQTSSLLFSKRRAAMEDRDRQEAAILRQSKNVGRPDGSIEQLEQELGIKNEGV